MVVFAAKYIHAEFQVFFPFFLSFLFYFFPLYFNFIFILPTLRNLPAAMLGVMHISTLK